MLLLVKLPAMASLLPQVDQQRQQQQQQQQQQERHPLAT
jgi:hypothetical protein